MHSTASKVRKNRQIREKEVRIIGLDGEQLGVMNLEDALRHAEELGLDLVEVAAQASPPVCKFMDFGKFQYQEKKKLQETKKKQTVIQIKEIKMRPKTDDHDLQTKVKHIRRFLEGGDRCKVTIFFRGREAVYQDLGKQLLDRVVEMLSDIAKVEQEAKFEGRVMHLLLSAKKK